MTHPRRIRHWRCDRWGNAIASGHWLGRCDAADRYGAIWLGCPACGAEQVVAPQAILRKRTYWRSRIIRDGESVVKVEVDCGKEPVVVGATCRHCRRRLAIHIAGRYFEPPFVDDGGSA